MSNRRWRLGVTTAGGRWGLDWVAVYGKTLLRNMLSDQYGPTTTSVTDSRVACEIVVDRNASVVEMVVVEGGLSSKPVCRGPSFGCQISPPTDLPAVRSAEAFRGHQSTSGGLAGLGLFLWSASRSHAEPVCLRHYSHAQMTLSHAIAKLVSPTALSCWS